MQHSTASDEALVSWYLICYADVWTAELEEENDHYRRNGDKGFPKRFKRKAEHYSRTKLYRYLQLEREIRTLRADSRGWDEAITATTKALVNGPEIEKQGGAALVEFAGEEGMYLPHVKLSDIRFESVGEAYTEI